MPLLRVGETPLELSFLSIDEQQNSVVGLTRMEFDQAHLLSVIGFLCLRDGRADLAESMREPDMFGLKMFVGGTLLGTCAGLFVTNYHVVNTPQGVVVVPRSQRPPLRSTYVDIRSWSQAMWANHPEVTQALIADGRSALIRDNIQDNLLNEILPEQTQDDRSQRTRNVAKQWEVPIRLDSDRPASNSLVTQPAPAAGSKTRLLDTQSPVRRQFESAFDEAIAPIVEDDPSSDAMIQQLEEQYTHRLNAKTPEVPSAIPDDVSTLPTSGDAERMARDLLQQVIPPSRTRPGSAAPRRDLGSDLLNAPAPGQGGASQSIPRAPAQSQLILSEPF
jgi:hypothetical protein